MTTAVSQAVSAENPEREVALVGIDLLVGAMISPRHGPPDAGHVRALREVVDLVPPILVHRQTMAVIDGAHRLAAARESGRTEIRVTFFDGDVLDAFVLAIQANSTHGRPLSIGERKGAARVLLEQGPDRSTRWIASVCGLAPSTVEVLRPATRRAQRRIGQDGRSRPVEPRSLQAAITERIEAEPSASVRQIATDLGVSPATVRRVVKERSQPDAAGEDETDRRSSRPTLVPDPFTRWLKATEIAEARGLELLKELPPPHAAGAARELRRRAEYWASLADRVDQLAGT